MAKTIDFLPSCFFLLLYVATSERETWFLVGYASQ